MLIVTFDACALGNLAERFRGDELAELLIACNMQPVLHVPAITELCATPAAATRARLLSFAEKLRDQGGRKKLLDDTSSVLRNVLTAWQGQEQEPVLSPPDDHPLYRLLEYPDDVTDEEREVCAEQCVAWDAEFVRMHGHGSPGRSVLQEVLHSAKPQRRPGPQRWMQIIWNGDLGHLLGEFYGEKLGRPIDDAGIRELFSALPTHYHYFAVHLEAIHRHAIRREGYGLGRRVPKWRDLSQFVYLAFADILVTDDRRLLRRLSNLCRGINPSKRVWSSDELLQMCVFKPLPSRLQRSEEPGLP